MSRTLTPESYTSGALLGLAGLSCSLLEATLACALLTHAPAARRQEPSLAAPQPSRRAPWTSTNPRSKSRSSAPSQYQTTNVRLLADLHTSARSCQGLTNPVRRRRRSIEHGCRALSLEAAADRSWMRDEKKLSRFQVSLMVAGKVRNFFWSALDALTVCWHACSGVHQGVRLRAADFQVQRHQGAFPGAGHRTSRTLDLDLRAFCCEVHAAVFFSPMLCIRTAPGVGIRIVVYAAYIGGRPEASDLASFEGVWRCAIKPTAFGMQCGSGANVPYLAGSRALVRWLPVSEGSGMLLAGDTWHRPVSGDSLRGCRGWGQPCCGMRQPTQCTWAPSRS